MAIDIKNFKVTLEGTWKDTTTYNRNDVVYWRGKSYRCIEDTLLLITLSQSLWQY